MSAFFSNSKSLLLLFLPLLTLCVIMPRSAAFIPGLIGLIFLALSFFSDRRISLKKDYGFWIVAALIPVMVGLSALWADDQVFVVERSLKLILIIAPAVLLTSLLAMRQWPDDALKNFYAAFYIMFCFCSLFIMFDNLAGQAVSAYIREHLFGAEITRNVQYNRSLVILALLYLPVVAGLQTLYQDRERYFHVLLASMCLAAALITTKSQTAQLCFLVAGAFYFLYPYVRMKGIPVLTGLAVLCMLAAPFAVKQMHGLVPEDPEQVPALIMEASIPHRLEVWNFVATETFKRPWVGHGVEALREMKSETWMKYPASDQVLHPHNAPMQIWLEFGLLGACLTSVFFVWMGRRLLRLEGQRRRLSVSLAVCCLLALSVGYGLWQSWQIGFLFLIPSLVILCTNQTLSVESKS